MGASWWLMVDEILESASLSFEFEFEWFWLSSSLPVGQTTGQSKRASHPP
jgi:hypothetical protein